MSTATLKQGTHTLTLIGQQDPTTEDLQILHDGPLTDLVQAIKAGTLPPRDDFRKLLGLEPIELRIMVDYSLSIEAMVALGKYDWKNGSITAERFPITRNSKHERTAQLIHFNRAISSDAAEKKLNKMRLRAGTIEELLAFGATFPETQRKFPIVALGSVAELGGHRYVSCLGRNRSGRSLYLDWRGNDWSEVCRFLTFAK